jgi:hypothetical protein
MRLSLPPFPSTPSGEAETRTRFLETGLETGFGNEGQKRVTKNPSRFLLKID